MTNCSQIASQPRGIILAQLKNSHTFICWHNKCKDTNFRAKNNVRKNILQKKTYALSQNEETKTEDSAQCLYPSADLQNVPILRSRVPFFTPTTTNPNILQVCLSVLCPIALVFYIQESKPQPTNFPIASVWNKV